MDQSDSPTRPRASTAAVLDFAWDAGSFGADQVIATLGLTRSTTLTALDSLIDVGLVSELSGADAKEGYRMGRPARRFELRAEAGVIVGIDAGEHRFRTTVADLAGQSLTHSSLDIQGTSQGPDPGQRRAAAFLAIDDALAAAGRTRADVVAVGVGIPAPVDGEGQSPPHPTGFWDRMNARLQETLAEHFPVVRVENDAALAAVAEGSLGEATGCGSFVAMLAGRRLGSGVFLDGHLVRGAHGAVGELGFLSYVPGADSTDGLGVRALEWARRTLARGDLPAEHPLLRLNAEALRAEDVLAAARLDDPVTRPLLEELGNTLGRICSVISRTYDPATIVVCGAVADSLTDVLALARSHVTQEATLPTPSLVASRFGGDIVSLGAVSAARERARDIVLPLFAQRLPS